MSWDFGCGDLFAGARLAIWIYAYGFTEENAADVRYKNFQNDILNFATLLETLEKSLYKAQGRFQRRRLDLHHADPLEPLSQEFEAERKTIVGNFRATLEDCEALLERNKQLRLRHSNVSENLLWHLGQQEQRVAVLRSRLQFHADKIRLVIDRLSLELLRSIDANVVDILALTTQNNDLSQDILSEIRQFRNNLFGFLAGNEALDLSLPEDSHSASDQIALRFESNLLVNVPLDGHGNIPLAEEFDAMFYTFQESKKGQDQTPEKYLLFLKARWFIERIKQGQEYQSARPGFYYKRALRQIEQAIMARVRTPGCLIAFEDADLLALPESLFLVWPTKAIAELQDTPAHPQMHHADEEEIAHITLACQRVDDEDTVTVFKRSNLQFRVVLETVLASRPNGTVVIPRQIHTHEDRLIPRYALPTLRTPSLELSIFSRGEEQMYKFKSLKDLCKFQAALTGFDVSHDQQNIGCQFSKSLEALDCVGRIQLWQKPIVLMPPSSSCNDYNNMNATASSASPRADSATSSVLTSITPASVVNQTAEGIEIMNINPAALVLFAKVMSKKQRYRLAIIFVELSRDVYIEASHVSNKSIVITSKQKLKVRHRYCDTYSHGQSDPNTFDVFPFCTEASPHAVESKTSKHLLLKCETPEEMLRLRKGVQERLDIRDAQIKARIAVDQQARRQAENPQRNDSPSTGPSRSMSMQSTASTMTALRPLSIPDRSPAFPTGLFEREDSTSPQRSSATSPSASRSSSVQHSPPNPGFFATRRSSARTEPPDKEMNVMSPAATRLPPAGEPSLGHRNGSTSTRHVPRPVTSMPSPLGSNGTSPVANASSRRPPSLSSTSSIQVSPLTSQRNLLLGAPLASSNSAVRPEATASTREQRTGGVFSKMKRIAQQM